MDNTMTINDMLFGRGLGPNTLSDEELASVYGGTFGDAVGYVAAGLASAGAAFVAVVSAPLSVPLVAGASLMAIGGGLSLGYGIHVW